MQAGTGMLDGPHGRIWYDVAGSGDGVPLLVVHGGPGFGHGYLRIYDRFTRERPVVYYDQIGCGRSDRPDDPSLWNVQTFADEIGFVRESLGVGRCVIVGHSIGPGYVVQHLADGATDVAGLVLHSPFVSGSRWNADQARLRAGLPADVRAALDEGERTGTTDGDAYQQAVGVFNGRHWCRVDPLPAVLREAAAQMNAQMVGEMYGSNPFAAEGNLASLELFDRLGAIDVPALVAGGRYDQVTPETADAVADALPRAQRVVFEDSGHMAHLREPDAFADAVGTFLSGI